MQRLFAVGLFGLLVWAAWRIYEPISALLSEPQTVVSAQMRQVGGSTISLLVAGWVEESRVPPRGRLKAWYRISNVGVEPIQDLSYPCTARASGRLTLEGVERQRE